MTPPRAAIARRIGEELERSASDDASDDAKALAKAARSHVGNACVVLLYGACRRDGLSPDAVADLYVLTHGRRPEQSRIAAMAHRLLPPEVIYLEADAPGGRLRAKAAIVELGRFERLCARETFHSYFWARFAQPTQLLWRADAGFGERVVHALADAVVTFATECLDKPPYAGFWADGFEATYAAELRAERPGRGRLIYEADQDRFDAMTHELRRGPPPPRSTAWRWRRRRVLGKALSVVRLAKATFTFEGGLDYILWKIGRHSGVWVTPKPWQRRWPLLAAPALALNLWRRGAFR